MRRQERRVQAAIIAALALAGAPAARADAEVTGFLVTWTGEFAGLVATTDDEPIADATVHIATSTGVDKELKTDRRGRYRVKLTRGDYVYVDGIVKLSTMATVSHPGGAAEAIEMHEFESPVTLPRLIGDPRWIPDYSDAATDRNEWAKAWLMLDIDDHGVVERVQLLKPAGLDLDPIAIRAAFALTFEPAKNRGGRPVATAMLWAFEWPAYYWMIERRVAQVNLHRMPANAGAVPCRGSGPTRTVYRDCSLPDHKRVATAPWISRPR
jgi:hypothetical protein